MKHERFCFIWLVIIIFLFGLNTTVDAANLSLVPSKVSILPGESFTLDIVIDNPTGVAGCAFTITYPADKLIAPDPSAIGIVKEITSSFFKTFQNTQVHRENTSTEGKILFSGVIIDPNTGEALYTTPDMILFTIPFTVKYDAPIGEFSFTLEQTSIFNINAGWGDSANPEPVPVLVGVEPNLIQDGANLSQAFPILLGDQAHLFTPVAKTVKPGITAEDSDEDGLFDCFETDTGIYVSPQDTGTNPNNPDSDDDEMSDGWEVNNGLDPLDFSGDNGKDGDLDNDGWTNYEEYINYTNPDDNTSPTPTPPEVKEVLPHQNAGIDDSIRIPYNTSFAIRVDDIDGIDITDTSSIKFTIDDSINIPYERNLSNTTVVRIIKLCLDPDTEVTKLWAVYDRSMEAVYGDYFFDTEINIKVDIKDRRQDWMEQESYNFKIETETEYSYAQVNLPDTNPVNPNDPALEVLYDTGIQVNNGDLEGAKIIFNSNEPVAPTFGPTNELPVLDISGVNSIGIPMNLQPPTVFNIPVKIFIPCPGYSDVSELSIYLYNGTRWVLACDPNGIIQLGGEGCIVPDTRVNRNDDIYSMIEIQLYHFSGVQAGFSALREEDGGGEKGDGCGCLVATATYGSPVEPHVKVLREFRDRFMLTNPIGRAFLNLYCDYSPPVADFISRHDKLRLLVRYILLPLIVVSWVALQIGLIATLVLMVLFFCVISIAMGFFFRKIRVVRKYWIFIFIIFLIATAGLAFAESLLLKGDISGDGNVGLNDSISALQILCELTPENIVKEADVNEDGKIGIEEAIYALLITITQKPPEIKDITSSGGNRLYPDEIVTISIVAFEPDGDTLQYQLLVDSNVIYPWQTSSTFELSIAELTMGIHSIIGEATDNKIGKTTSAMEVCLFRRPPGPPEY